MDRGAVKRAVSRVLRETDAEISNCPYLPRENLSSTRALRRPAGTRLDLSFVICERTVFLTSGAAAGIRTGIEHRHASRSRDALKS